MNSFKLSIPANYRGVVLTCLAFGTPSLNWFKITEIGREQLISFITNEERIISTELIFQNGFQALDAGEYVCLSNAESPQAAIFMIELGDAELSEPSCSVDSATSFFQIRVLNTRCNVWGESLKQVIRSQFLQSIMAILSIRCDECSINANNLMLTEGPVCSILVDRAVLFRGSISIAFCDLNTWQRSGPIIVIDDSLHLVDQHCDLKISSLSAPECPSMGDNESFLTFNVIVIGSASAFGLLVVMLCFMVLVLVIRCRYVLHVLCNLAIATCKQEKLL